MSKIKVNSIEAATGSTITIPSGQTLDISSTTLTLPSTVVTTTGTQTLTNKTIGVSQLSGTLPVANGGTGLTTLGSASQVLRVNSGATALEFGTLALGKVLQVVTSSTATTNGFSHNTIVSVGSVSITPSSASSKIYITTRGTLQGYDYNAGDSNLYLEYYIFRDSTELLKQSIRTADAATNSFMANTTNASTSLLDSPSTTSAISYSIRAKVVSETSNTGDFSDGGIIAMEIGA